VEFFRSRRKLHLRRIEELGRFRLRREWLSRRGVKPLCQKRLRARPEYQSNSKEATALLIRVVAERELSGKVTSVDLERNEAWVDLDQRVLCGFLAEKVACRSGAPR